MQSVGRTPETPSSVLIYCVIKNLASGQVASYGEVAAMAGLPGRARLVGTLLRNAPKDLNLPWHRVLRANGQLAFAKGSEQFDEQVQRLRAEGLQVINGRVQQAMAQRSALDSQLWKM